MVHLWEIFKITVFFSPTLKIPDLVVYSVFPCSVKGTPVRCRIPQSPLLQCGKCLPKPGVSKVIRDFFVFALPRSVVGPENSWQPLNQWDAKRILIVTWSPTFSRAFDGLPFLAWVLVGWRFFPFVMICCSDFIWFQFFNSLLKTSLKIHFQATSPCLLF